MKMKGNGKSHFPFPSLKMPRRAFLEVPITYRGWWILAVAALAMSTGPGQFAFGALGLFIKPLGEEFGWGRAQVSLAATYFTIALAYPSSANWQAAYLCLAAFTLIVTVPLVYFFLYDAPRKQGRVAVQAAAGVTTTLKIMPMLASRPVVCCTPCRRTGKRSPAALCCLVKDSPYPALALRNQKI